MISGDKPGHQRSPHFGYYLNSNIEFEEKLTARGNLTGNRPFAGRSVKIRKAYTLTDRLWEMAYHCAGNKKAIKSLYKEYEKQYFIKKLLKLLSVDEIALDFRRMLETSLEKSTTFQRKVKQIETISLQDLRDIRKDVQSYQLSRGRGSYMEQEDARSYNPLSKKQPLTPIPEKIVFIQNQDIAHYEEILSNPDLSLADQVSTLHKVVRLYTALDKIDKAIQCYEQLLNLGLKNHPEDESAHAMILGILANLYQKNNDLPKAIECTKKASILLKHDIFFQIKNLEALAEKCIEANNPSGAVQCYEFILTIPQTPLYKKIETHKKLRDIYLHDTNYIQTVPKLIESCERIADLPGASLDDQIFALSNIGCIYHETQRQAIAITYYERVVALPGIEKQKQYTCLLAIAQLHYETDDLDKQIESYERIFALSGIVIHCQYVFLLAELYRKKGTPDKAIQFYENQLKHIDESNDILSAIDPISIATQLVALHEETNNIPAQIKYLNLITTCKDLSTDSLQIALKKLRDIYLKTNNTIPLISILTQLAKTGEPHHYEEILKLPAATPLQQYNALIALANIDPEDPTEQINYYKRILKIPNLQPSLKLDTLRILATFYSVGYKSDYTSVVKLSSYFKQITDLPEITSESKYTVLCEFLQKYRENQDKDRELSCLKKILKIPNLNPQHKLLTLQSLVPLYKSSYMTTAESRTHEAILATHGISLEQRRTSLVRLRELYKACRDYKEIKTHELILELPNLTPDLAITSLSQLAKLYTKSEQKISCYKRIFELENESNAAAKVSALHQWLSLSASSNIPLTQSEISSILTLLPSIYTNNHPFHSHHYNDQYDDTKKCYELILKIPDISHDSLQKIAIFFNYINNTNQSIECYERILRLSDLTSDQQLGTLKKLTGICSFNEDKTKQAIKYSKLILASPQATLKDQFNALSALGWAYSESNKTTKAILSYERILTTLTSIPDSEYHALTNLAEIYRRTRRPLKAIECYDRILKSSYTDEKTKLDTLKKLALLCRRIDIVDKEIWCHEQILSSLESTLEDHDESLNKLSIIYGQIDEASRTIEGYERVLKIFGISLFHRYVTLDNLAKIYHKTKNIAKEIECYEFMLTLSPRKNDECTQVYQSDAFDSLNSIFDKYDDNSKRIKAYERILNLPNLTSEIELAILKLLLNLYRQLEDPSKQIQCLECILRQLKTKSNEEKDIDYNIDILTNLADLYNTIKNSEKEEATLHELILIYREIKDVQNEIKCLKRILSIPNALEFHPHPTLRLAQLYQENNDAPQAIEYYERYLKLPYTSSVSLECHIMEQLAILYKQINNNSKAIEYYERLLIYLKSITPSPNRREEPLQLITDVYLKTDNIAKCIECYNHLAILHSESNNIAKEIECYEQLLGIQAIKDRFYTLIQLISLYEKTKNIEKQIEFCKLYLILPNLKQESKINTLKKLIHLHLDSDDFLKAREYEYEILKINPTLLITTLLIFINHPKFGLHNDIKALINIKPEIEKDKILQILASYYWLWANTTDKPKPLTIDQWTSALTNEDTIGELERLALQPCLTVCGLNHDYFFNDPTMPEWNVLDQIEGHIDDSDWKVVEACTLEIFDTVHEPNAEQRNYLSKFFSQCMASNDAKTSLLGKELVRKRIASCIQFLVHFRTSQSKDQSTIKVLKDALAIMTVGAMGCPDRAVVFIPTLEIYIKLLKNPIYLANIMVQMYKFEAITKTLVPEVDEEIETKADGTPIVKERENLETFLSYRLKLNKILGLGLRKGETMLYEHTARTVPLQLTIEPLSAAFTDEKLINFTIQQDAFKTWVNSKEFEAEKTAALASKETEYIAAIDDYTDAIGTGEEEAKNAYVAKILTEIKQLEKEFYIAKARQLFLEAGFLSNNH